MKKRMGGSRLIDFLLYTIIALGVLAFGAIYAVHAVRTGEKGELPLKWIGLAGETAVVFGYCVRAMRSYWKRGRFWAGLLGFFAVHLAVCSALLLRVERLGLLWFVFIAYAEWLALAFFLAFLLDGPQAVGWHHPRGRGAKSG